MADPVNIGVNKSKSPNPTGRAGLDPDEKRGIAKQTQFNESELERVNWARKELGLDWSSFLRYAALQVTKQVIG